MITCRRLREGVTHEELELADLVARLQQARQVVALQVQLDTQPARHALELHDGGGRQGKLDARGRVRHASHPTTQACCFFNSAAMGAKSYEGKTW